MKHLKNKITAPNMIYMNHTNLIDIDHIFKFDFIKKDNDFSIRFQYKNGSTEVLKVSSLKKSKYYSNYEFYDEEMKARNLFNQLVYWKVYREAYLSNHKKIKYDVDIRNMYYDVKLLTTEKGIYTYA